MIRKNTLQAKLRAGEPVVGSWISVAHPTIAEVMAQAGFDWLSIDMEHGTIGIESVLSLVQAINTTATAPLVRVPWNDSVIIKQVLETGPMGLVIPQVSSAQEATAAVHAARYPPQGIRGIGCQRAAGFGAYFNEYLQQANQELVLIVQIEHKRALESLPEILTTDGVDVALIGANDLAASMGLLGQPKHPQVLRVIEQVLSAAVKAGVAAGIIASDPEDADRRISEGFQFIGIGHDVGLLSTTCRELCGRIHKEQATKG